MKYKNLKYRHLIVKALYDKFEKDDLKSKNAYDLSLSLVELEKETGIPKEKLKKELAILEMQGLLKFYGRMQNVKIEKWFLLKHEPYLDSTFVEERKVKIFDSYKRILAYFGIPLGLILSVITISSKMQSNSNSNRLEKIENPISINTSKNKPYVDEIAFYEPDSINYLEFSQDDKYENITLDRSNFLRYKNMVLKEFKDAEMKIKELHTNEISSMIDEEYLTSPFGMILFNSNDEFMIIQGIQSEEKIKALSKKISKNEDVR